jgi:predicted DNA-binding ribbon-helix-helix protein
MIHIIIASIAVADRRRLIVSFWQRLKLGVTMKSLVEKRSIVLAGHKTSVSLEDAFLGSLRNIAKSRNVTLSALVTGIDSARQHQNLSSAVRLFVLNYYRDQLDIRRKHEAAQSDDPIQRALGTDVH